jgi:hypothetical protein
MIFHFAADKRKDLTNQFVDILQSGCLIILFEH